MNRSARSRAMRRAGPGRRPRGADVRRLRRDRLVTVGVVAGVLAAGILAAGLVSTFVRDDPATRRQPQPEAAPLSSAPADPTQVRTTGQPRSEPLAIGGEIPSFAAPALSGGGRVDWRAYAGRPAVVTIWAPWCPHCQAELPVLADVMADHPGVGLVTVTTAVDPATPPTPEAYLAQHDLNFVTAVDDELGTLARAFGVRGFPTIYFVDRAGVVQRVVEGEIDRASLDDIVSGLA